MCSIWLELGDNRIPMTRKELASLAGCIRSHRDLGGIDADILEYLDDLVEPIPTNDTLVRLAAIASAVRRCPVPDNGVDRCAEALTEIGAALAEAAIDWHDDASFAFTTVIGSREQLRHWEGKLFSGGYDQYAYAVHDLVGRIRVILPELR